ncbi:MAG: 4Fe-4S binding protein [Betaproteobacteria bacterium]|nr:MAG: 4Fe-4S binding protein [Betaproteobacteria bacterium]
MSSTRIENTQPIFNETRCVHDRLAGASCQACAVVCPTGALSLGEDALELDVSACNGCMLCAAACPQEAIDSQQQPVESVALREGNTAYFACAHSGVGKVHCSLPCVHALSWRDLLRLYGAGVRGLVVTAGDCGRCDPQTLRLDQTVLHVNEMLSSRRMREIEVRYLESGQFNTVIRDASAATPVSPRRRAFLRRMVDPGHDRGEADTPATVAALLGESDSKGAVFPAAPLIDAERCDGCDACTRVCPTGALALVEEQVLHYRADASRCTGCHLCVDVCEPKAISLWPWTTSPQQSIALNSQRCSACGVDYHAPTSRSDGLCTVCLATYHHRKLFQVDPV